MGFLFRAKPGGLSASRATSQEFKERHRQALLSEGITGSRINVLPTLARTAIASVVASCIVTGLVNLTPQLMLRKTIFADMAQNKRVELVQHMSRVIENSTDAYPFAVHLADEATRYADLKILYYDSLKSSTYTGFSRDYVVITRIKTAILKAGKKYSDFGGRELYGISLNARGKLFQYSLPEFLENEWDGINMEMSWKKGRSPVTLDTGPFTYPDGAQSSKDSKTPLLSIEINGKIEVRIPFVGFIVPFPWFSIRKRPKAKEWSGGGKMRSKEELKPFIEEYRKKYFELEEMVDEAKTREDLEKISAKDRALIDEREIKFTEKENRIIINELRPLFTMFANAYSWKNHQITGGPLWKF